MTILLNEFVRAFPEQRALVLGDVMLDEYVWGEVTRISPEAPVPVVQLQRRTFRPGGAANVAANIICLGGEVLLGSVIGDDDGCTRLRRALAEENVPVERGLIISAERTTTVKTRIVSHSQHMLRLDLERVEQLSQADEDALIEWFGKQLPKVDVCIVSDYAKGVITDRLCQEVIAQSRRANIPLIVDPKGQNFEKYRGASVLTPNMGEMITAVKQYGEDGLSIDDSARLLGAKLGANILVTKGADGMSLYTENSSVHHLASHARRTFDVTGAGDTVVATFSLALAAGASWESAAEIANLAAGIVVTKFGTSTVSRDELLKAIS